ncbi:hypothetical protein PENTCL1PPCAC_17857 [Pristionchus entomophagus]|uniref:Uncharacterized protein n=1 Tax=Pristionchus entomophagus TaxID=358040 RepID=A0AAV5TMT8_9BILA|nr:hypothetical protein PENTCL1PPCAC_17857 [Pristionchus entomophagus]
MLDDGEKLRAEKRARSEAKRLEAIRTKAELIASRDRVVGLGLKDVDIEKIRKKMTFDSESEDEEKREDEEEEEVVVKKKMRRDDDEGRWKGKKKGEKLFESDDEAEEEEIVFKNRHKGEKGIKLMEQEARYGNDHRFKLNEKFEESDAEKEDDEEMDQEQKELRGEKEGALSVLSRILGKEMNRDKMKKDKKTKARPFTRFDPDNEEHVRWMRENTKKVDADDKKEEEERKEGEEEEKGKDGDEHRTVYKKIAVEGRFFEMGGDFARELKEKLEGKKTDNEPFSFLASIGRKEKKIENKIETDLEDRREEKKKDEQKHIIKKNNEGDPIGFNMTPSIGFFFDVFSLSARSVVANFRRTQSMDKVKEKWSEQRESIIKTYKNQRRFAVKNSRDEKKGYDKKEGGMFKKNEEEEEQKEEQEEEKEENGMIDNGEKKETNNRSKKKKKNGVESQ